MSAAAGTTTFTLTLNATTCPSRRAHEHIHLSARFRRDQRGISLVEMLVVCVFVGLLATAFSALFSTSIRHSTEIGNQKDLETQMRGALDPMIREVRQAYSGTTSSPIETIATTGTPIITFTTPIETAPGRRAPSISGASPTA